MTEETTVNAPIVAMFTEEQIAAHDFNIRNSGFAEGHSQGYLIGISHGHDAYRNIIKEVLLSEVRDGNIDREYALSLFNAIAEKASQPTLDSIGGIYKATVSVFGSTILELEVEADDADAAYEQVSDEVEFDNIELTFSASHGLRNGEGSVNEWEYSFEEILRENMEIEIEEA